MALPKTRSEVGRSGELRKERGVLAFRTGDNLPAEVVDKVLHEIRKKCAKGLRGSLR